MKATTLLEFQDLLGLKDATISPFRVSKAAYSQVLLDHRVFLKHHRAVGHLCQRGKPIGPKRQRSLLASAMQAEQALHNSLQSALDILCNNKAHLQIAQAKVVPNFDDFRVYSSPIFLDTKGRNALLGLGLSMSELRYNHMALTNDKAYTKVALRAFKTKTFETILQNTANDLRTRPLPDSLEALRAMGLIAITGGSIFDAIGAFVGGIFAGFAAAVVSPILGVGIAVTAAALWAYQRSRSAEAEIGLPYDEKRLREPIRYDVSAAQAVYANISRSKMEVHFAFCPWIQCMNLDNIRVYNSLSSAHSSGFDNCAHCIGGSKR